MFLLYPQPGRSGQSQIIRVEKASNELCNSTSGIEHAEHVDIEHLVKVFVGQLQRRLWDGHASILVHEDIRTLS
jgi:hypothetical protein